LVRRFAICGTVVSWPWFRRVGALVLVAVLAACGTGRVPNQPATGQAPAPAQPFQPVPGPAGQQVKVALLLPLTGNSAALGESLLQAAQMALFEAPDDNVALVVRDTGDSPTGAAQAAQDAIRNGARLILGPLFAGSVRAVAPVAQAAGVSVVSFSTDLSVAAPGVFVMGIVPSLQVQRVVGYAGRQGLHRVAALLPQSAYGQTVRGALEGAAKRANIQVVHVDFYDPRAIDASTAVGSTGQFITSGGSVDALLVPETRDRLHGITGLFGNFGIDPTRVRVLGSTLWDDDPAIGSDPMLVGAWFAAPDPGPWQQFRGRFHAAYASDPPRLATIAYDATLLAAVLSSGSNGPDFSATALTDAAGFGGVDGIFRFKPDGTVERGLAVMEVHDGFVDVRDPSPSSFDQALY
jgi:branched-chain amino acid transport system substrate-binding protein